MIETVKEEWSAKIAVLFFIFITAWWLFIRTQNLSGTNQDYAFAATYGLICLWGGVAGLIVANKWGGFFSTMGKAITVLSLGLLAQEFGQLIFSYYNIFLHIEVPYPSVADYGFFGSVILYIIGISLLAKASGVKVSLKKISSQIQVILIPGLILLFSYVFFLKEYEFDLGKSLQIILDFGYPLGEAIYISIAMLTYSLSRNILGGVMRSKILFLIVAFVMQYIAEFNFLLQSNNGTWVNGGYGDYLYFLAYFIMTLGLIQLKTVFNKLD